MNILKSMRPRVGIIGYGAMGKALAARISRSYRVVVFDKNSAQCAQVALPVCCRDISQVFQRSDALILAVKPQDFDALLQEIRPLISGQLVISIAAGIPTGYIQKLLGPAVRVVRVMPNLPAKVGRGISGVCPGQSAGKADLALALKLFSCVGQALCVDEAMMDAVTAVSGSGPGFFFAMVEDKPVSQWQQFARETFIPQLAAAARNLGFSPAQGQLLAQATSDGSLALLKATGLTAQELRIQVTSKGGTTEAGLKVLAAGGSLAEAAQAAAQRSKELSRN